MLSPDSAKEAENTALAEAREEEGEKAEQKEKEAEGGEEDEEDVPDETLLVTPPPPPSTVQVSKSTRGRSKSKCTSVTAARAHDCLYCLCVVCVVSLNPILFPEGSLCCVLQRVVSVVSFDSAAVMSSRKSTTAATKRRKRITFQQDSGSDESPDEK